MGKITEKLAEFVSETQFNDLPQDVVLETKRVLLDSIGCAIAGASSDVGKIGIELAKRLGGPAESTIVGTSEMVSCANAAFANGQLINALDYDAMSTGHDVPTVIAASLAMVESDRASGKDLILATALGLEVSCRVNAATGGKIGGFGFTAETDTRSVTAGRKVSGYAYSVFGAAASAGKIMNLNKEMMANALGIAGYVCMPNVLTKMQHTTPIRMSKYAIFGWGAQGGVTSALLADMGFEGDTDVFTGEHGFWRYTGYEEWEQERVVQDIDRKWLHEISYKQYPAGT
jgi:2-methylcitrate dehydratase PrpD